MATELTEVEAANLGVPVAPILTNVQSADNGVIYGPGSAITQTVTDGGTTTYMGNTDPLDSPPAETTTQTVATTKDIELTPTENILHRYASYTYNLSISILTENDFLTATESPQSYTATNVLVASAGRFGDEFKRHSSFTEDFYFEKLSLETIIGMNAQARNSNAIHTDFVLIEPYGITFLNRLIDAASSLGIDDYTVMPYMLQIDFFGYDDAGTPIKIPGVSKYIPIRILEVKMKISHKGSEYTIQAVPFNHQAFNDVIATTPFKLEVTASNIAEFFLANVNANQLSYMMANESQQVRDNSTTEANLAQSQYLVSQWRNVLSTNTDISNDTRTVLASKITDQLTYQDTLIGRISAPKSVRSYTGALNAWLTELETSGKVKYKDTILFDIDPEIAAATFPTNEMIGLESRAYTIAGDKQDGLIQHADDKPHPNGQMAISQNTSIIEVISLAIRNSSYIYDQILDVKEDGKKITTKFREFQSKPLRWFKIIPKIKIGKYDKSRGDYSKIITYQIVPYVVYNTKNDEAPQGKPNGVVKQYNYMFTGANNDIINFDITFDTLYYILKTANTANIAQVEGAKNTPATDSKTDDLLEKDYTNIQVQEIFNSKVNGIPAMRPKIAYTGGSPGTALTRDSKSEITKELQKNVLNTQGGDMISLTLKIIGDPDLIKQDDFFYSYTSKAREKNMRVSENGSIIYDAEEIFARITFNSPSDYNDLSGLATPNSDKYSSNIFSGIYKILRVTSHFTNGKFEQELTLVRYPNQPSGANTSGANDTTESDQSRELNSSELQPMGTEMNPGRLPITDFPSSPRPTFTEIGPGLSNTSNVDAPVVESRTIE